MSRIRKIYKKEEDWDCLDTQQELIMGKAKDNLNKAFKEDNSTDNNPANTTNSNLQNPTNILSINPTNLNHIAHKFSHVSLNNKNLTAIDNDNKDETDIHDIPDIQDLLFEEEKNENVTMEANEEDYDNFYENVQDDNQSRVSESTFEKNKKRTHSELNLIHENDNEEEETYSKKKFKFN